MELVLHNYISSRITNLFLTQDKNANMVYTVHGCEAEEEGCHGIVDHLPPHHAPAPHHLHHYLLWPAWGCHCCEPYHHAGDNHHLHQQEKSSVLLVKMVVITRGTAPHLWHEDDRHLVDLLLGCSIPWSRPQNCNWVYALQLSQLFTWVNDDLANIDLSLKRCNSGSRWATEVPKKGKSSKFNFQDDGHINSDPAVHV